MGSKQPSSPEGRIANSLFALVRAMGAGIRRAGASVQLTVPQFSTLRLLDDGELSVGELARTMRVAMPTVTQRADSLVGKGLVERYADEKDRRQVKLRITAEGRKQLRECHRAVEAYLSQLLSPWTQQRQDWLVSALEEIQGLVMEAGPPGEA